MHRDRFQYTQPPNSTQAPNSTIIIVPVDIPAIVLADIVCIVLADILTEVGIAENDEPVVAGGDLLEGVDVAKDENRGINKLLFYYRQVKLITEGAFYLKTHWHCQRRFESYILL